MTATSGTDLPAAALITGVGGALGRAMALRLSADGYRVAVLDVDSTAARVTAEQVEQRRGEALALTVDLRDADAIEAAFARTEADLAPVRVLVDNAAICPAKPFLEISIEVYDDVQHVNQRAYWSPRSPPRVAWSTQAVAPSSTASVIGVLVGEDAAFVTGQCIEVNDGWVMT